MRTLTVKQKEQLVNHIAKKPIEYIELYNELFDHYASAYENGEEAFEETIERLDDHFHYQKVKAINTNLIKKTKKSVNEIYWTEFKNFWRWPQILTTLGFLLLGFFLIEYWPTKVVMWSVVVPMLVFNAGIFLYGLFLSQRKKFGSKKFKSAYLNASQFYLSFPTSIFNLAVLLPVIARDSDTSGIHFFEQFPIVALFFMIVFFTSSIIGIKVFKSKIRVQYL